MAHILLGSPLGRSTFSPSSTWALTSPLFGPGLPLDSRALAFFFSFEAEGLMSNLTFGWWWSKVWGVASCTAPRRGGVIGAPQIGELAVAY